jgi:D-alanine-D-alanine ligase
VGIVFGGRSNEHEISVMSAASVFSEIDKIKYEPVCFAISRSGHWYHIEKDISDLSELSDPRINDITVGARKVTISEFDEMTDFAFPVLHGPYGEDGTIQGLFEMLGKPYAGCGVAASAVSMDKILTKEIWDNLGLPVCGYTYTTGAMNENGILDEAKRIESLLGYPAFIKPANMGSSVGVSMVSDFTELVEAIENAFRYDSRIIAEQAVTGRELEIGITGNGKAEASVVGEILPENEYYDYDSKYKSDETKLVIPASIPESVREEIEQTAKEAYLALNSEGFARIDLFYDEKKRKIYLNEMNAIPGFTKYSMFPLLWQAKGIGFSELIERIISLGYERHNAPNHR